MSCWRDGGFYAGTSETWRGGCVEGNGRSRVAVAREERCQTFDIGDSSEDRSEDLHPDVLGHEQQEGCVVHDQHKVQFLGVGGDKLLMVLGTWEQLTKLVQQREGG